MLLSDRYLNTEGKIVYMITLRNFVVPTLSLVGDPL